MLVRCCRQTADLSEPPVMGLPYRSPGPFSDPRPFSSAPSSRMHMQGEPRTMQEGPSYRDVVQEVRAFLEGGAQSCRAAGLAPERIVIDPGFGFGKTLEHNLELLRRLAQLTEGGLPVLVGLSR